MRTYTEVVLKLHHLAGDDYAVDLRYRVPGSAAEAGLPAGHAARARRRAQQVGQAARA